MRQPSAPAVQPASRHLGDQLPRRLLWLRLPRAEGSGTSLRLRWWWQPSPSAGFFYKRSARTLTEKDSILLTDFVNTTGDAVFDGTLKQALAVQLEQSPYLNVFPQERVRDTLKFMGRSPDERLTPDLARDVCQREGIKAVLNGAISMIGTQYVVDVNAVNCQTGDSLAREQVQADKKEQVLGAVGKAASSLRGKLGESLASVQKFDAPVEEATTSSLEALKAFSLGETERAKGDELYRDSFLQTCHRTRSQFCHRLCACGTGLCQHGTDRTWRSKTPSRHSNGGSAPAKWKSFIFPRTTTTSSPGK